MKAKKKNNKKHGNWASSFAIMELKKIYIKKKDFNSEGNFIFLLRKTSQFTTLVCFVFHFFNLFFFFFHP